MDTKDPNDDFTFSIEGKEYTISEKSDFLKNKQKQTLDVPSLTIGAIISGICIAVVFFGMGEFSGSSQPLIEKQLTTESIEPTQITQETFMENGSTLLGNPNASITLIEFGDYLCHFCNVYYQNTEHQIYENYVMTGKINVIFKDYTIIGPDSFTAAHAAHCAADQGKFWQYHDTLYDNWDGENNGWAGEENMLKFAQQIELDMDEFIKCNTDKKYEQRISASNTDAQILKITGTPAFYVFSKNNQLVQAISGSQPYEVFEQIFNSMLKN